MTTREFRRLSPAGELKYMYLVCNHEDDDLKVSEIFITSVSVLVLS